MCCSHMVEDPTAILDAIKPTNRLNNALGLYRSRVGGTQRRKLPSKAHLKKMNSSGDILDNIPRDILSNLDKPLEDSRASSLEPEAPPPVPSHPEEVKEVHTPTPQPKPRPRAAPRKKPHPTPPTSTEDAKEGGKKPPQAAPRARTHSIDALAATPRAQIKDEDATKSPKQSPKQAPKEKKDREPPTQAANESPKHPAVDGPSSRTPKPLPSPSRPPLRGPKPQAKREVEGKPPAKDPPVDASEREDSSPHRSRTSSLDTEQTTAAAGKDPLKLSVKEKALLAQKTLLGSGTPEKHIPGLVAMGTPERHKPGPPIPRKPKPTPTSTPLTSPDEHHPSEHRLNEASVRRAKSIEDDIGASPQHKKKLPPGAFNMMMMGGVSVFGPSPGGSSERGRSATVSTFEPGNRERNSLERERGAHDDSLEPRTPADILEEENRGEEEETTDDSPQKRVEQSPSQIRHTLNKPPLDDTGAGSDTSMTPPMPSKHAHAHGGGESVDSGAGAGGARGPATEVDYNTVLTWTPDITCSWLEQVGLGAHQQVFAEKGIQGYMLFDMDGHRLKVRMHNSYMYCTGRKV